MHITGFNAEIATQVALIQMGQDHSLKNISLDFFQKKKTN